MRGVAEEGSRPFGETGADHLRRERVDARVEHVVGAAHGVERRVARDAGGLRGLGAGVDLREGGAKRG